MTEAELQDKVTKLCNDRGLWWMHITDSRRVQTAEPDREPGWPDLTILGRTRGLFVELKSEDGRRSMAQIQTATLIIFAGFDYVLWRPLHLRSGQIAAALDRLAGL